MQVTGWGHYPRVEAALVMPRSTHEVGGLLRDGFRGIARGLGRSYGDSSLAPQLIDTSRLDHFLAFDPDSGQLRCEAGVSLAQILATFVPRGWFLPVTPGTKYVTVGGAVASDVHGKNHHVAGTFCDHVMALRVALPSGDLVECSPSVNPELFRATCGGMGLTGVIVEAEFRLHRIASAYIDQTTCKARNLAEVMALFEEHAAAPFSVAWIDCLASGPRLGRSLLNVGDFAPRGYLTAGKPPTLAIPVDLPGATLNRHSIRAFNALYYGRVRQARISERVHYEPFFYPLDGIGQWHRMYGKGGFTQYQFVLPRAAGLQGMRSIIERIAQSRRGSFLAVLKAFGPGNDNYLSFPTEGYTLALDFKLDPGLFRLLEELDHAVLDYGGRIYLTKDVRMRGSTFKRSYPQWEAFAAVRARYGADRTFFSLQSQRLGI